ncbi:hypothetical protein JCM21900_002447 [Sporobolomyces salmonicolor]
MSSDAGFPTPAQLVDKVPLIKNPGFWIPRPVELPLDIHPLPDDVQAYFVYPHTLEQHVLTTLPQSLSQLEQAHSQRLHLLVSYADSKERARKARLNQVAPGYAEGGGIMQPVRRETRALVAAGAAQGGGADRKAVNLLEEEGEEGGQTQQQRAERAAREGVGEGSFLGETEVGSPKEMGLETMDKLQRDQMQDWLDKFDGGGASSGRGGGDGMGDLL